MEITYSRDGVVHSCLLAYENVTDFCYCCGTQDYKFKSCVLKSKKRALKIENVQAVSKGEENITTSWVVKSSSRDAQLGEVRSKCWQSSWSVRNPRFSFSHAVGEQTNNPSTIGKQGSSSSRVRLRRLIWLRSRVNQILLKGVSSGLEPLDGILTCLVLLVPRPSHLANFPYLFKQNWIHPSLTPLITFMSRH